MKRILTNLILVSTIVLLAACQSNQTKEVGSSSSSTSSTVQTSTSSSQETSSSSEVQTDTSSTLAQAVPTIYQSVIERYQANLGQATEAINQDEVSSYLALPTSQGQEYSGAYYSLYDIDQDGKDELLIALNRSDEYVLIDLYTQLSGSSLRLVDSFRNIGIDIGPDALLRPLQDGTYLFEGNGIYRIYQFNAMIPGLKQISESDTNPETSPLLDLTSLTWTKLDK
ncbi:TPA: colicin lysis protein [Streptococcus suis]|nr:colicin lysis protein [Streptococcus suis]HEM6112951.1 colicin lysis protein [Streptococcus suis]HEM6265322.1 colicin lysis protein [Streptococcus suis]HEM6308668.1 colicin lysis protein [Streptococcus suis]HEM6320842.1 colicin lysis protein [Streptococcus suis]